MGNQASMEEVAKQQVEEPKNQPSTSQVRTQVEDKKKPPTDQDGRPQLQEVRKLPHSDEDIAPKATNTPNTKQTVSNLPDHTQRKEARQEGRPQLQQVRKLPHNDKDIAPNAKNISNTKQPVSNLPDHTQSKEVQKEEKPSPKSYVIPAKELAITWSEEPRYWSWQSWKEPSSNTNIEVAHLLNVCWLEVHGKFDVSKLSSGIVYEIVFVVMLKDPAYGWEVPVNLKVVSPQGQPQQHQERLVEKLRGQWIELHAGDFTKTNNGTGDVEFSFFEYHGGQWKRGLIVKGAIIRPRISMG
ncbi:hypothetical protein H6P81_019094 [Aristolochia fimbriata]|uniref:Uncharacterized protein n=1 Tax=Aristolochia fimbriata TaxID=158543 RepID=A0AAV7DRP7_ARIFI|nr:hypothetical protein H6P81_019094 [Aristolochia fimbriata]